MNMYFTLRIGNTYPFMIKSYYYFFLHIMVNAPIIRRITPNLYNKIYGAVGKLGYRYKWFRVPEDSFISINKIIQNGFCLLNIIIISRTKSHVHSSGCFNGIIDH